MTNLEFYLQGDDRMGEMLAWVSCAPQVPAKGSVCVIRHKQGEGFKRYRVQDVEYWFDEVQPESVPSAVVVVLPEGEA